MTGKTFVDTNILIYAHDRDAGGKSEIAATRMRELWAAEQGVLSVQVLQEFFVNVTRKIANPLPLPTAREVLRVYRSWVRRETTAETVLRATELMELARLSFWDALIIAAAEESGADTLLSEDLNDGQIIAGVKIVNPFNTSIA